MITLKFYTVEERKPNHGEDIVWLKKTTSFFGADRFQFNECNVEYQWLEIDEKGEETGCGRCYEEGDRPLEGYVLNILFDGWDADECLWCPIEEFGSSFDE